MPLGPKNLVLHDYARYFFISAIGLVLLLFFWIISPFFSVLVYAALIAVVFQPVYRWFLKLVRGHTGVASFFSTVLVVLVVLIPLTLFTLFLAQQAVDAYQLLDSKLVEIDFKTLQLDGTISDWPVVGPLWAQISEHYGLTDILKDTEFSLLTVVQDLGEKISTFLVSQSASVLKSVGSTLVSLLILLLTIFFFFRDGLVFTKFLKNLSPLPTKYENEIENKLRETTYAIVVGGFGTSMLQGLVGGIGFAIAGVENIIFWGTIIAFASLIPYVGAALIWVPMSAALFLHGDWGWGLFLLAWGICLISVVDNVARPWLVGRRSNMHPLATFLVVLGGLFLFGLPGVVFGPLVLSLTVTIVHIYRLEYREILES